MAEEFAMARREATADRLPGRVSARGRRRLQPLDDVTAHAQARTFDPLDRPSTGSRIVRRVGPSAAPARALGVDHVRPAGRPATIRRAIDQQTWTRDIEPSLRKLVLIKVTNDVTGTPVMVKGVVPAQGATTYQTLQQGAAQWVPIPALPAFLAGHTWDRKFINNRQSSREAIDLAMPAQLTSHLPERGDVHMDVRSVDDDRHSLVHHSLKTYKQTPKKSNKAVAYSGDHHLTVENAHLLLMDELKQQRTTAGIDKRTMMKPDVEAELTKRGYNAIDNLNFYPRRDDQVTMGLPTPIPLDRLKETAHPDKVDVDQRLSLMQYLTFIQRALDSIGDVPPVYGAKILHTAQVMQQLTGWDPATMFLRVGSGDQRHLIRAVVAMEKNGLITNLALPPETKDVFTRYCTSTPDLPLTDPVVPNTEWVAKGSLALDRVTHYNQLETRHVDAHIDRVITAILAFLH